MSEREQVSYSLLHTSFLQVSFPPGSGSVRHIAKTDPKFGQEFQFWEKFKVVYGALWCLFVEVTSPCVWAHIACTGCVCGVWEREESPFYFIFQKNPELNRARRNRVGRDKSSLLPSSYVIKQSHSMLFRWSTFPTWYFSGLHSWPPNELEVKIKVMATMNV